MKQKFWNYLRGSNGYPIEGASINVFAYPEGGGLPVYAYIYLTMGDDVTTTENHILTTDANGYFEFYIADIQENSTYGYPFTTMFKITWEKLGMASGEIDRVELFDVNNREVDETDTNILKNKMVSNYLANRWEKHISITSQDDHLQYLKVDGTRSMVADWDMGAGRKILVPRVSAREGETLRLTSYDNHGIIVSNTGQVNIENVQIAGGYISGVTLVLDSFDLSNGILEDATIGMSMPSSGAFTWVEIASGSIDNTVIGYSVPTSGIFTDIVADDATITNLNVDTVDFGLSSVSNSYLTGDWNCTGEFRTSYLSSSANLSILDSTLAGIFLGDGGYVTIGNSEVYHRLLTVISEDPQQRLQFSEASYVELFVDEHGSLTITGTGDDPAVYFSQNIDLVKSTISGIGVNESYFTTDGDLYVNGYISILEDYRINGETVLSTAPASGNIFVGTDAGSSILGTSYNNSVLGHDAAYHLLNGDGNVFVGAYAGFSLENALNNVAIGFETMSASASGSYNTYVGYQAGHNAIGDGNVFIGHKAGYDVTGVSPSGSNCLYINNDAGLPLIFGSFASRYVGIETVEPIFTLDVSGAIRGLGLMVSDDTVPPSGMGYDIIGLTNVVETTLSTGDGTIKMADSNPGTSSGWLKIYINNEERYIPYFTTIGT